MTSHHRKSRGAALALAAALCSTPAAAEILLSRISVDNPNLPGHHYSEVHRFPEGTRDYTTATLDGYGFRHDLSSGAVREIEVARLQTPGAYLIATDLFANGRFSTMSHTVLMAFPRRRSGTIGSYELVRDRSGDLRVVAPDGSILDIDGRSGGVRPSADFRLDPIGAPGTPPGLHHRGLHLEIRSVGRSPFLRGTPVTFQAPSGARCRLRTEDVFAYGAGPESDLFRFATDVELASFLSVRCPELLRSPLLQEASLPAPASPPGEPAAVPLLLPAATASASAEAPSSWSTRHGGLFGRLFSY